MAVKTASPLDPVVQLGLLTPEELHAAEAALPEAKRTDVQELCNELLRRGKLTKFQVNNIVQGKAKGLVLGSYILQEPLGQGGMGAVFRARHTLMERVAAVKLLPVSLNKDPETVQRFTREVKAAAKLVHPNIVQAYDAGSANGRYFLAMECVDGKTLDKLVKERGKLPVSLALEYMVQAAQGLGYAHQRSIVHRDIKPANLIVGSKGRVQILDMGLARILDEKTAKGNLNTGADISMGTVDFMAPEQALAMKRADARSDIYSLGCTLYFLIRGEVMFNGGAATARMLSHQQKQAPSLCDGRNDVPLQLDAIYQRMVAKAPEDRYQNMSQVLADLQKCLKGGAADTMKGSDKTERIELTPSVKLARKKKKKEKKMDPGLKWGILGSVAGLFLIGVICITWSLTRPVKEAYTPYGNQPVSTVSASSPGEKVLRFTGHTTQVEGVAFSSDGRRALSAASDKTVILYDVKSQRAERVYTGHTGNVYTAVFTNKNRQIVSASADQTVRLWDVDNGNELYQFRHDSGVICAAVSNDGKHMVSCTEDGPIYVWDLEKRQELFRLFGHEGRVWCVAISPDGRRALSGGHDKTVRYWDLDKRTQVSALTGHSNDVRRVTFSPGGDRALSASWDGTMRHWNLNSGQQIKQFGPGQFYVEGVRFTPDGRYGISSEGPIRFGPNQATGNDHGICIWELESGRLIRRLGGIQGKVLELTLSPDGKRVLFACQDKCARQWDLPMP
ncbi:MAG TPA: serine/threonine-protein kinase [Gemmataceae bacterium]|jgi:serine/threonine protein kinase|nr:serine/threonine-protein kinase [Gemmataceae bacterium]